MIRSLLLRSALAGALAWAGFAVLAGMEGALHDHDLADRVSPSAIQWRVGIPQVTRLERFAAAARPHLPPGERIAFASPPQPQADLFYRHRWAAYLLPETDLVAWEDPASREARYLLAFSFEPVDPRLRRLQTWPEGGLYAVSPR